MKRRASAMQDAGLAHYVRRDGGFVPIGPASIPTSAPRFFRGTPPLDPGVPLFKSSPAAEPRTVSGRDATDARKFRAGGASTVGRESACPGSRSFGEVSDAT
jgi:hypothetical protein